MSSPPAPWALLVIAGPASWLPDRGCRIRGRPLHVHRAASLEAARSAPATPSAWDVVAFRTDLADTHSPEQTLAALRQIAPEATLLPVTSRPEPREALTYLKHGAFEYLEEPLAPEEFLRALAEALDNRQAFREIVELNQALERQKAELVREKEELQRKNRELDAVARLARAMASSLDVEQVAHDLARCVRDTLGFERVAVGTLDPATRSEQVRGVAEPAGGPARPELAATRWLLDEAERHPWIRTVYQEGRPLRVDAPDRHPQVQGTPLGALHREPFVKLPLVAQGRIVGSLTAEGRIATDEELAVLGVFADTAAIALENARLYQTMRELSLRDELTGLYNRRHLLRQLEAECVDARRHGLPLSVLMIDIDHFKQLNDGNDHLTGDAALRQLAELLLQNTRGIDTAARYGGEEFMVVLPRTPLRASAIVGEKLRRLVERTAFAGEAAVPGGRLTISLGAAALSEQAQDPRTLIERADRALYRAKSAGRNRVWVWEGTREEREVG
ncbi:MAG: hypothetical protein Kow0092_18040 [Deferrisomatales bacterium]